MPTSCIKVSTVNPENLISVIPLLLPVYEIWGQQCHDSCWFLHDVVEDTDVTIEELEQRFWIRGAATGGRRYKLNLTSPVRPRANREFRRMFLAMAQDIRVIVVKLADRLHNMRH